MLISQLKTLLADLLWEKNIIRAEKTSWKVRIINQMNKALDTKDLYLHSIGWTGELPQKKEQQERKKQEKKKEKEFEPVKGELHLRMLYGVSR
jgi:hypothetical protein